MINVVDYKRAMTVDEALKCLKQGSWRIIAGGTDILPQMRAGVLNHVNLLDIQALREDLGQIKIEDDFLVIGALCTHNDIANSELVREWLPPLAAACSKIGSAQIRKRGTLGGNVANASPAADAVPVLVAAEAEVLIASLDNQRIMSVGNLAAGPGKTTIKANEMLLAFRVPLGGSRWTGTYEKVGIRNALQISIADFACLHHSLFGYRIACGSVAPTIRRARRVESLFSSWGHGKEEFEEALLNDISPIDDIRASGDYRRDVLTNLIYNLYVEGEKGND